MNGRKFRRQTAVGPYVVDFLCTELRLIIELDGGVHAFQEERDIRRQSHLESMGYMVVRFTNDDILANRKSVLEVIWSLTKRDLSME